MFVIICCRFRCIRPLQGRLLLFLFTSGLRRTLLLFDFLRKSELHKNNCHDLFYKNNNAILSWDTHFDVFEHS